MALLHLPHPPLPPPSIMGVPQGVYKWPWKIAAECPPARAPATSPVSTLLVDLGKSNVAGPRLGVGVRVKQLFPGPTLALVISPRVAPAWSGHSSGPWIRGGSSSVFPQNFQPRKPPSLATRTALLLPRLLTALLFPQSSTAWCYCVRCVGMLPRASTTVCMPVRAVR